MRRIFILIVTMFVIFATLLIYLKDNPNESVKILSLDRQYSRLLTESDELITVPIYLSTDKCFLKEPKLIDSAYIKNNDNQILVKINNIRYGGNYNYKQELYYLYLIDISLNQLMIDEIEIQNAFLELRYQNAEEINIKIGDFFIKSADIENDHIIDVYRTYLTVDKINNQEYTSGMVIGFTKMVNKAITINEIKIENSNVCLDLAESIRLENPIEYNEEIENILGKPYYPLNQQLTNSELDLEDNELLFIPFSYQDKLVSIKRFPIIINYTYLNKIYEYNIDDFMFISESFNLEADDGTINEYIYNY